ncbi:MAG: TRAM domain-containing protein, partial [Actinobacteria bacterium]|nr:TRAM domain-containing protein [Actinomycetota bacterium]
MQTVTLDKLVHGGQAIARLKSGKRVFVWNGLPGEKVTLDITRDRKGYAEAIAVDIIAASSERIAPKDTAYLSTSPWQMMTIEAEQAHKARILAETIERAGITLHNPQHWHSSDQQWHYRNKMEYNFFADECGLQLALFERGSHRKQVVQGSSIARVELDETAQHVRDI